MYAAPSLRFFAPHFRCVCQHGTRIGGHSSGSLSARRWSAGHLDHLGAGIVSGRGAARSESCGVRCCPRSPLLSCLGSGDSLPGCFLALQRAIC